MCCDNVKKRLTCPQNRQNMTLGLILKAYDSDQWDVTTLSIRMGRTAAVRPVRIDGLIGKFYTIEYAS